MPSSFAFTRTLSIGKEWSAEEETSLLKGDNVRKRKS
jgi:hypothetical protein